MDGSNPLFPKLRPIQPDPVFYQGQHYFLLRDPLRLHENTMLLPGTLLPLLFLCDGTRNKQTILQICEHHFETLIAPDALDHFLKALDELCLLENGKAAQARARLLHEYRAGPYRKPASAGLSYPDDPKELHNLLQNYLEEADGEPGGGVGLFSPHVDYPRGGRIYAQVWKRAANMIRDADLFILLGTDHYGGHNPITLTRQNYATPYGTLPTEQTVVDALVDVLGEEEAFAGELYHRTEHSLELVLNWLHHLRGARPAPVVPILVGWLLPPDGAPSTGINTRLVDDLVQAVHHATRGRNVSYIISGDLAHIGPAFHGQPLDEAGKAAIHAADQEILQLLAQGDAETFLAKLLSDYAPNNVCGTFPAYLALRLMSEVQGEVTGYAQCPADAAGASIVSVGGVVFRS